MSAVQNSTAAEMLDKAVKLEKDGRQGLSERALAVAIQKDDKEAAQGQCSLPRK